MKIFKITENQLRKIIEEAEEEIDIESEEEIPNWRKDFDEPIDSQDDLIEE